MPRSLLDTFRSLDHDTKDTLADLDSPLLLSFAALAIAQEKTGVERLSAEHITACLEAAGIAVKKNSVSRALARASDRVSTTNDIKGETLYRLMIKGQREIAPSLGGGQLSVVRIDGTQPRTDRLRLGEVLSQLRGVIRICDPYYGVRTLDSLDYISATGRVHFLTAQTTEEGRRLRGAMRDFARERPNVDFRKVVRPSLLHDRYVVTNNQLLILGHGLKDIGGRESFMIRLSRDQSPDLIRETIAAFDGRWRDAAPL
ncbi:MAG: hypothetical protein V3T23_02570 [Nitrososphaerales archaeon]